MEIGKTTKLRKSLIELRQNHYGQGKRQFTLFYSETSPFGVSKIWHEAMEE